MAKETKMQTRGQVSWGPWRLQRKNLTLVCSQPGSGEYEIDLEEDFTSEDVLDWIAQVAQKQWADAALIGHLVVAFDDLAGGLQGTIIGNSAGFNIGANLASRTME